MVVEHEVWFVVWPGIQPLDLTGPHEVFATANRVADAEDRGGVRYRLRVVAAEPGPIRSESGLSFVADGVGDGGPGPDTVVLPGGDGVRNAATDPEIATLVAGLGRRAERVATVCTGTFLAAAAGLLRGRRVATHWAWSRHLADEHPDLTVDADALHVHDGRVWSSAGVTAGIDLALALVEHDHDAALAQQVGRWLVVHLHRPGGQSQFASPMWAPPSAAPPVHSARRLIEADPAGHHTVARLADRVGVSSRHLTRLFLGEVGETPARYVERVRVETARTHLERGDHGLATVARLSGFGTAETMRRAFHRRLGVAPDDYRSRFRLTAT